jgi:Mg-chelatase subunit ChlD
MGGLAKVFVFDVLLANRVTVGSSTTMPVWGVLPGDVTWYDDTGNQTRLEMVCDTWPYPRQVVTPTTVWATPGFTPLAPLDNEYVPSRSMGDVEVLCGPTPTPTARPQESPTPTVSPTRTATATASRTRTATATLTVTPTTTPLGPIYLPLLVNDHCDPNYQHADVVLVIDASSSMLELTRAGRTKMAAAEEAALLFLEHLKFPGDQVAIVSFNVGVTTHTGLTDDRATLEAAIGGITNEQYTRIHLGIQRAHEILTGPGRRGANTPAMIVLTDGINTIEPGQVAIDAAAAAKRDGITIFTVGLGEENRQDELTAMASRPDYFHYAPDGEDLGPIYERIAYEVPCPPTAFWPYRP